MANFAYNTAAKEIADGTIDLLSDTIKVMAVTSSYVADRDDDVVDDGGADDPVDHEITATGYTGAWGGAGRKALAGKSWVVDKANDRAEFTCNTVNFGNLGNGANNSIAAFIVIKEGGANDTTSRLILYIDTTTGVSLPYLTDGSQVQMTINAEGLLQIKTT